MNRALITLLTTIAALTAASSAFAWSPTVKSFSCPQVDLYLPPEPAPWGLFVWQDDDQIPIFAATTRAAGDYFFQWHATDNLEHTFYLFVGNPYNSDDGVQVKATGQGCGGKTGPAGPPGPPGPAGPAGATGSPGVNGAVGATGAKGDTGTNGAPGAPGTAGVGTPGVAGKTGTPGARGVRGPHGKPGTSGRNGAPGLRGSAGANGKQGAPGRNGKNGAPGKPGKTGSAKLLCLSSPLTVWHNGTCVNAGMRG